MVNDIKQYVIIDGREGVFENKIYYREGDAKIRAYDAVKNGETKNGFDSVSVQEIGM